MEQKQRGNEKETEQQIIGFCTEKNHNYDVILQGFK